MARLAFDIDDTITNSTRIIKKHMIKHMEEYEEGEVLLKDLDIILRGFFTHEVVDKFFKDYALTFANDIKLRKDAKKIINKLYDEGNEIYIITARSDKYYVNAQKFCEDYLTRKGVKFNKIIVNQKYKVNCCIENKIDVMVDDGVDTCDDLTKNNIKALLYSTPLNVDKESISKRVYTWNEVYDEIHKTIKN